MQKVLDLKRNWSLWKCIYAIVVLGSWGEMNGQQLTLDSAINLALDNNAALKSQYMDYQASLHGVDVSGVLPDPELGLAYFVSPIETRTGPQSGRLSAMQTIPWKGVLKAGKNSARAKAQIDLERFEQTRDLLASKVEDIYYRWALIEAEKDVVQKQFDVLKRLEEVQLSRFEAGEGSMAAVFLIQLDQNKHLLELDQFEEEENKVRAQLSRLFNSDEDFEPILPELAVPESFTSNDRFGDSTIQSSHLSNVASSRLAYAQSKEVSADLISKPSFKAGLQYFMIDDRNDMQVANNGKDAVLPSVGIRIPIHKTRNSAWRQLSKVQSSAAQERLTEAQNKTAEQLKLLLAAYEESALTLAFAEEQLKLTIRTIEILTASYSANTADIDTLLQLEQQKLELQRMKYKAAYGMRQAIIASYAL